MPRGGSKENEAGTFMTGNLKACGSPLHFIRKHVSHAFAGFEFHGIPDRNRDHVGGLIRITPDPRFPFNHRKHAELAELNMLTGFQRVDDTIQRSLDDIQNLQLRQSGIFGDPVDEIAFFQRHPFRRFIML
jgi:hypothetical protein